VGPWVATPTRRRDDRHIPVLRGNGRQPPTDRRLRLSGDVIKDEDSFAKKQELGFENGVPVDAEDEDGPEV